VFVLAASVGATALGEREEIIPQRVSFDEFPENIGGWEGKKGSLETIIIDALKFDDYFIGDYVNKEGETVNFYVAYYGSQKAGESAHSPRSCIPGGGWLIKSHDKANLDLFYDGSVTLPVNRLLIQKGDYKQLVYYWFDQRGRAITNEYLVKWYLFWDSLTKNRSDGSLVRLTAFVAPGEDLAEADRRLTSFAKDVSGILTDYIPD
jgi:EpsI family protein